MVKLFLDDVRQPYDDSWYLVRNYAEFCQYITDYKRIECPEEPLIVSFDHDLGLEHYMGANVTKPEYGQYKEKTGYHCVLAMLDMGVIPSQVIVHSWNTYGAKNIQNLLTPYCSVVLCPFHV